MFLNKIIQVSYSVKLLHKLLLHLYILQFINVYLFGNVLCAGYLGFPLLQCLAGKLDLFWVVSLGDSLSFASISIIISHN